MIAALACYENRLAALLDTAVQFQLYRLEPGKAEPLERLALPDLSPAEIMNVLSKRGVETVVCGAVSEQLSSLLSQSRIKLMPWVCGELNRLSVALANGSLEAFTMPGCCGRRRLCRGPGPGHGHGFKWKQHKE